MLGSRPMSSPHGRGPALVGVVHLPPLPGSPRFSGSFSEVVASAARDAGTLARAGFDAVLVENFGDAPDIPDPVGPERVAAMTACVIAARKVSVIQEAWARERVRAEVQPRTGMHDPRGGINDRAVITVQPPSFTH